MAKKTIYEGPKDGTIRKRPRTVEDEGPDVLERYREDTDTWEPI